MIRWFARLWKRLFGVNDKFHQACKHNYEVTNTFRIYADGD